MRLNRLAMTIAAVALALAATSASASAGAGPTVRPNPDEQGLITSAQPAPGGPIATRTVQPNPDQQTLAATNSRQAPVAGTPAVIVRVGGTDSGFDWGDAGIGAAGALGLALIAVAGGLALSKRRGRRTGSALAGH